MPKFEKGSKEAKAWGDKMRKAREAKKSMKGGMIKEDTNNEIKINKMKKIVGKGSSDTLRKGRIVERTIPEHLMLVEDEDVDDEDGEFEGEEVERLDPIVNNEIINISIEINEILHDKSINYNQKYKKIMEIAKRRFPNIEVLNGDLMQQFITNANKVISNSINYLEILKMKEEDIRGLLMREREREEAEILKMKEEDIRGLLMREREREGDRRRLIREREIEETKEETEQKEEKEDDGPPVKRLKGGYLQPGEIPLALNEYQLLQDKLIEGEGVCNKCKKCKMCGGSLSKSLLKVGKSFGKVGETLNPMSYALKNKGIREAMIKSGEITQDYAIPAITTAGLPLYYGAAGTAGMMLGGPLGALAATEAADMLWQEQVAKKGYDPQQRQKSKTLAMVSKQVGKLGASQLKKDLGPSKPSAPPSKGKGLRKKKKVELILLE